EGERRFEIVRTGDLARVAVGYHIPNAVHADTPAVHLLSHVLGNSGVRTSRLYKSLVETGMVSSCYAYAPEKRDPTIITLYATVNDGVRPA
ncbi:insulinase family protein, partial [Acinetobacter baumannii]